MTTIDKKLETCYQCKLRDLVDVNQKFGPTYGYGGNLIMVCGLAPSYIRGGSKRPLSREEENRTAKILFDVFDEVKWPEKKTYFTNLVKCSLPKNREPELDEIDTCFDLWFTQELMLINPIAVVAMGKYVYNYLNTKFSHRTLLLYHVDHFAYINRRKEQLYDRWKNSWAEILSDIKEKTKEIMRYRREV